MPKRKCFKCGGSGNDPHHRWPEGDPAPCDLCDGYGEIDSPRLPVDPDTLLSALILTPVAIANLVLWAAVICHTVASLLSP